MLEWLVVYGLPSIKTASQVYLRGLIETEKGISIMRWKFHIDSWRDELIMGASTIRKKIIPLVPLYDPDMWPENIEII